MLKEPESKVKAQGGLRGGGGWEYLSLKAGLSWAWHLASVVSPGQGTTLSSRLALAA